MKQDSPTDASAPDAATLCDPLGAFSAPVPLGGLATGATELIGSLSPDELTVYPWGLIGASTTNDIYVASRSRPNDVFGQPTLLANVSTDAFDEGDPRISSDGLTMLFRTTRDGQSHIYVATRPSRLTDFGMPAPLSSIQASDAVDRMPFVTADDQELWFVSTRNGGLGANDVWRAVKSGSAFASPGPVPEVSSTGDDLSPLLTADKLTIYISSTRPGGMSGYNIWRAHRISTSDGFGQPELVNELNTDGDDIATWLSSDGCRLYLRSNRNGTGDVFVAARSLL